MRAIDDLEQSQRKFLSEISNIQSKFIEQRNAFYNVCLLYIIIYTLSWIDLIEVFQGNP